MFLRLQAFLEGLTEDEPAESDSRRCRLRQGLFSLSPQQQKSRRESMQPEGQITSGPTVK